MHTIVDILKNIINYIDLYHAFLITNLLSINMMIYFHYVKFVYFITIICHTHSITHKSSHTHIHAQAHALIYKYTHIRTRTYYKHTHAYAYTNTYT